MRLAERLGWQRYTSMAEFQLIRWEEKAIGARPIESRWLQAEKSIQQSPRIASLLEQKGHPYEVCGGGSQD